MKEKLTYFVIGFLAAMAGAAFAQTNIIQLVLLGNGTFDGTPATADLNIANGDPDYVLDETDADADDQTWSMFASAEVLRLSAFTDDGLTRRDILTVNRTNAAIDDIDIGNSTDNPTVTVNGSSLPATSSGTFEITWETACTTTPSQTWDYEQVGNIVTIYMVDNFSCTSDITGFASTGADIPLAIRPAQTQIVGGIQAIDNSSVDTACLIIPITGTPSLRRQGGSNEICNTTTWTGSGTKGLDNTGNNVFTYMLTNP